MSRAPGLPDAVRSEWAKLRSLRSTAVVLALAAVLAFGLAALLAVVVGATWDGATPRSAPPTTRSTSAASAAWGCSSSPSSA